MNIDRLCKLSHELTPKPSFRFFALSMSFAGWVIAGRATLFGEDVYLGVLHLFASGIGTSRLALKGQNRTEDLVAENRATPISLRFSPYKLGLGLWRA